MLINTKKSPHAKVYSIPESDITWKEGFWKDRFDDCANITIPHILSIFDDKESFFHQVENFKIAAGLSNGEFRGTPYGDGDFYKLMEGMMYTLAKTHDKELDSKIDSFITLIGQAQQPDGYLSTKQIIGEKLNNGVTRNGDIDDFEVYNFGHLFTAACTHKRITGKDSLMDIAIKTADYLEQMYHDAINNKEVQTAVCPSHYMGLVELYRTTEDERFLKLAELAISLRDKVENGTDDNQDRIPLREHNKIVGHGVRSTYLYAGVADLYLENGDETLLPVLNDCWNNMVDTKLYINGGCGALYTGTSPFGDLIGAQRTHQAFGYEYQLPNVTAYNETCATLGSIFWAQRMFAIDPQAGYYDLIERSTYNLALAAVSLDGNKYFYENMLRRTKEKDYDLMWPVYRADDFSCFCCPTNLSRHITEVMEYTYTVSDDSVLLGVYGSSEASFSLENGAAFTLVQDTDYPWNGKINFSFKDVKSNKSFNLKIRVPSWAYDGYIVVNGKKQLLSASDVNTFVNIPLDSPIDSNIEVYFDMKVQYTQSHSKVEENTNQVAVQRGPLVYCLESPDADVESIDDIFLLPNAEFKETPYDILGKTVISIETEAVVLVKPDYDRNALYQPLKISGVKKLPIRLIPYFAWDNRGFGEMRIWIPIMYQDTL